MTAQAGIVLGGESIRCALVDRGVASWRSEAPVHGADSIGAAVAAVLAGAPPRLRRAPLGICVSSEWVQVKTLPGVPPVKQARLATQIVRENERAFFLARGRPLAIAGVWTRPDGTIWGAAFDSDAMVELTRALRAARLRVDRVVPLVIAMENSSDSDDPIIAARMSRRLPLAWRPDPDASRARMLSFARLGSTGLGVALAAAFTLVGPGLRAERFFHAADDELQRTRDVQREVSQAEGDLRKTTETLNRLAVFQASRGLMSRMLGDLSQTLPESTALVAFHVDSVEGAFTAIAPHVADVLPELTSIDVITSPKIVGSVTRETIAGAHVERATFRFRRPTR